MPSIVLHHLLICSISLAMQLHQSCLKMQRHLVIHRSTLLGSHMLAKLACMLCMLSQVLLSIQGLLSKRDK